MPECRRASLLTSFQAASSSLLTWKKRAIESNRSPGITW